MHFPQENAFILILMLLKFVPDGSIVNKSAVAQVMARSLTGAKPLPEPMLTKLYDAIWCQ